MATTTLFVIVICIAVALGALIGVFKKATKLSFWGISTVLAVLVSKLVAKLMTKDAAAYPMVAIILTVGVTVLFVLFFEYVKEFLKKRVAAAKEYSEYKNKDRVDENEAYKMDAVDANDKKEYRRLRKKGKKIKNKAGGWGVFNRLLGVIVSAADWLVAVGSIICVLFLFVEIVDIPADWYTIIKDDMVAANGWVNFGKKFSLDVLLVGTLVITIKSGFKKGAFYLITPVVVIGLLVGFGYGAYAIASSSVCEGMVNGLKDGLLSSLTETNGDVSGLVARLIIAAVIFLLSLIIVVVVGKMLPKLLDKFRDNDAFYVIDGVFGTIISLGVLVVCLLAIGGIAYTLNDLPFMEKFTQIEAQSSFADCFYALNPMAELFKNLPLRGWLEPA